MARLTTTEVENLLGNFAEVMSRLLMDTYQQHFAELDLTLVQAQALRILRRGPIPTGQIATELKISAPAVTQLTNRLIAKRLIERQTSAGDRRLVLIALSSKGRRLVGEFRKRRGEIFGGALSRLSAGEQEAVVAALRRMGTALESYESDTPAGVNGKSPQRVKHKSREVNSKGSRKMKTITKKIIALVAVLAITASAASAAPSVSVENGNNAQVSKQVRHELVTLPYYGIFDNLAYQINGHTVTLSGQVVRPTTRTDAARRVAQIAGVSNVVNQIEVLPLSPFDDSIRASAYRQIFSTAGLYRYALGGNPSLHIIVDNGHLTLEGVVANEGDSRLAYIAARQVSGAFLVTNNLRTERQSKAY